MIDGQWRVLFQFLGRNSGRSDSHGFCLYSGNTGQVFQFLGRNSGRSDFEHFWLHHEPEAWVSIPRSEFWSFGRRGLYPGVLARHEFQFLGRNSGRSDTWRRASAVVSPMFQFLGRNSGRSDSKTRGGSPRPRACFNSSVGILVVRTCLGYAEKHGIELVSIPRSEFWSFGRAW